MFGQEDLTEVLENNSLPQTVANKLLSLYVCEHDWWPHVVRLHQLLLRSCSEEEAKRGVKEAVAFAVLLPSIDKTILIDYQNPSNNLFRWQSFHQKEGRDWFKELQKVVRKDAEIAGWRQEVLSLGVIDPIDYQPFTRQAFEWICIEAEKNDVEITKDLDKKFRYLVMMYGGSVLSYLFDKHKKELNKITNWRSGYFIERAIYNVYSVDQVMRIKQREITKTNPQWIKQVTKG